MGKYPTSPQNVHEPPFLFVLAGTANGVTMAHDFRILKFSSLKRTNGIKGGIMAETMTIQEIKAAFTNEWIFVEVVEKEHSNLLKGGCHEMATMFQKKEIAA